MTIVFDNITAKGSNVVHGPDKTSGKAIPACCASAKSRADAAKKKWAEVNSPVSCGRKACKDIAAKQELAGKAGKDQATAPAEPAKALEAMTLGEVRAEAVRRGFSTVTKGTKVQMIAAMRKAEAKASATPGGKTRAKIITTIRIVIDHRSCEHEQTYEERVLCRKAFWAARKK